MVGALLHMQLPLQVDEDSLPRHDIALKDMAGAFQGHRLTAHHDSAVASAAKAQRTNAIRVAKRQNTVAGNHRNHRVGTANAPMHATHRLKHIFRLEGEATGGGLEFVGQHVEQHLGVAVGVDVPVIDTEQLATQFLRIGEVAVVHQHQAERRIDVKGLCLFLTESVTGGRVAHLS